MKTISAIPLTTLRIYRVKIMFVLLLIAALISQGSQAQGRRGTDRQPGNSRNESINRERGSRQDVPAVRSEGHREAGNMNSRNAVKRNEQPTINTTAGTNNRNGNNNGFRDNSRFNNNRNDRSEIQNSNRVDRNNDIVRSTTNNSRNDHDYGTLNRTRNRPVPGNYYNNNNYRRPVYSAYNPNWRYGYLPRRNSVFNVIPSTYLTINFGGLGYRYWDGIYYRPHNNAFIVTPPPIGIYINVLPVGYRRIYVHDYPYYYYNGTYYDQRDNNYYVVSPPVGAVVESLPDGYETVSINGETYYTVDGAQYKPVVEENGEIWYEVIKAN